MTDAVESDKRRPHLSIRMNLQMKNMIEKVVNELFDTVEQTIHNGKVSDSYE